MKLLTKTSYYYIFYTIPVLIVSAVVFYFFLQHEIGESTETVLKSRVSVIEDYIRHRNNILLDVLKSNNEVSVTIIDKNIILPQNIKDTLIFSDLEREEIAYKKLEVSAMIKDKNYKITVLKNTIEFDELIEVVSVVFITFLVLLFLIVFFINIKVSKQLWKPFWTSLASIQNFNVANNECINLESSSIKEFNELNTVLNQMTRKMVADYQNQKKFTENASHEFQTPFAIIKGKIGLLLQNKNIDQEALELMISIEDTVTRLSRINKSLLLLSKIENRQFKTTETLAIATLIEKLLDINEDLMLAKKIKVTIENSDATFLKINAELGSILFNNLIQNAIRHNRENGLIHIVLTKENIAISNSGALEPLDQDVIFERFEKQSSHSNSIGLGLAIVKEIAEVYQITISYSYENHNHVFSLNQFA